MPYPDKPIRFLDDAPVKPKPTVKRPPAGAKAPPRFDDQGQVVEQKPVGPPAAAQNPPVPKQETTSGGPAASSSSGGAAAEAPEVVGGAPAPSEDHLRRQAFIRQEQMARSRTGLRLLHDGATYQDAIESSVARELAEQRQAADAAALAQAKPKGPPPHLVGTEAGQPFGAQLGGQQLAPEVTTAPPARAAPSRPPPEVTTPAVMQPPSSSAASSTPPSAPTPSTMTAAAPSTSPANTASATGPCAGVPPPPTSPFPPVDRVGRAGYGTRNQIRRPPAPGLSTWDAFRFPLHEPGRTFATRRSRTPSRGGRPTPGRRCDLRQPSPLERPPRHRASRRA